MASFTDTAIPKFNPYIQQLPVEAMVSVGMDKQRRYDAGYQRIQSQIDQVAGMDIIHPEQKLYLQSKLNELGNNLKGVAAADFSNFQLVNSVGGMVGKLAKDPIIQNAVSSTQKVQKQTKLMEEAIKEGKSSPENEYWLNSEINSWINNPNLSSSFNGKYIPYKDVNKKLRDLGDKIKELDNTVEIPYKRDNAGNIMVGKDGNPIPDDAILQIKTKSKSVQTLLNNFKDSLDEGDQQQLMITANYHYRNATVDGFRKDITNNYQDAKTALEKNVIDLTAELSTNGKLSAADRAKKEAQIKSSQDFLNSNALEKARDGQLSRINSDKDLLNYKYSIYTDKYLNNLAKDMSYESIEYEYKNNPYAQMDMERQKLNLTAEHYRQQSRQWYMSYQQKEREIITNRAATLKTDKSPIVSPDTLPTGNVSGSYISKLNADITEASDNIQQIKSVDGRKAFSEVQDPDKVVGYTKEGKPITNLESVIDKVVAEYVRDPNPNAPYINNNGKRLFLERIRSLEMTKAQLNGLSLGSMKHVEQYDKQVDNLLSTEPGWTVNTKSGQVKYSAKELYDVASLVASNKYNPVIGRPSYVTTTEDVKFDEKVIMDRYKGTRLQSVAVAFIKDAKNQPLTPFEKTIVGGAREIYRNNQLKVEDLHKQKTTAQDDFLAKRMPSVQSYSGTLNTQDKEVMQTVNNLINNKINEYRQLGAADVKKMGDFNPETIKQLTAGKNKDATGYVLTKKYGGTGVLTLDDGTTVQKIPLSSTEMRNFFPETISGSANFITDIKAKIIGNANFTTNSTGTDNPVNAYISGYNIPGIAETSLASIVRMDVKGANSNIGDDNDLFEVLMYVNTPNGWKQSELNKKGYVDAAGLEGIMRSIGTTTVEDVIKYGR
jgi:hypothetical protein